jgi:hypothetical protein
MVRGSPNCVEEIHEVLPPEVPTIPLKTSPFDAVETVIFGFWLTVEGAMNGTVVVGEFLMLAEALVDKTILAVDDESALEA